MAYHFGWSIEYISSLSLVQFSLLMDGLGEILRQKYDPKYEDENKAEIEKKLLEIRVEREKKLKEKKGRKPKVIKFN